MKLAVGKSSSARELVCRVSQLTASALWIASIGCAPSVEPRAPATIAPSVRVVLADPEWATGDTVAVSWDAALERGFEGSRARLVKREGPLAEPSPSCAGPSDCAVLRAKAVGAERVVLLRLATLGGTVLLRVGWLDVTTTTREEEHQVVVREATRERIEAAFADVAKTLSAKYRDKPAAPPSGPEWYEEWWVWTLAGAAVVGTGVGVTAGVLSQEETPDFTIVPP